jgi:alanine racemase
VPRLLHSANSAAALRRGGYGGDLVRPGIFLYGGAAGPGTNPEPVAALRARVALVREVPEGSTCGYGATYRARRRERWGTLAIGYGDGLPRALSPAGGEALVRGRRVPLVGRISMDVAVVDLTGVPDARAGDVATLIGRDGAEEITVDEVAARVGTISYEILTGLTPRLPRVYAGL